MATAAPEIPLLARDLAFERLYRRYVKDVYHYALALLRNPADAEDVTQTTFLNAYRAFKRGEEPRKPHNWLIKIAHNAARTRYARSTRRVAEVPLDDHIDALAVAEEEKPDLRAVLEALGELPLNQRGALVMRELEGRSYADIAETLGVSVPAVETLIFRARRTLKLKASAVRALGVVPLPSSLTQLMDGGTVVVGGGAAIGTGFLLKAALAVVAGVVATGVGGGRQAQPADAASTRPLSAPPWTAGVGAFARPASVRTIGKTLRAAVAGNRAAAGPGVAGHRKIGTGEPAASVTETKDPTIAVAPSGGSSSKSGTSGAPALPPVPVSTKPVQNTLPQGSVPAPPPLPTLPAPPPLPLPSVPTPPLPAPPSLP
jgi:RNA polymerase sigma factor (sigma-70 family)